MNASFAARIATAAVAGTMALSVFGLAGCSQSGSDDADRIAQLEQEIAQLKEQQNGASGTQGSTSTDTGQNAAKGSDATGQDAGSGQTATNQSEITDATVLDFSNRADALIAEADAATAPSDRSQLIATYFDFDSRFDALEVEIDRYGDQKEMEYRNGAIAWEDYRVIDAQLDGIEARLDYAKDGLEWRFGVDD